MLGLPPKGNKMLANMLKTYSSTETLRHSKRYATRNGEFARRLQAAEHESTWPQPRP